MRNRSYNEDVVRRLTKEQFLEQHPEAGADYDRIVGVKPTGEKKVKGVPEKGVEPGEDKV